MGKTIKIKTSVKYNELQQYKKKFQSKEIFDVKFQLFLNGVSFPAILKYGLVSQRLRYDRRYKFKAYFDGVVSNASDKKIIQKLYELNPSNPILMMELLFAKERQDLIKLDNGNLEYHFTFVQY